MLASLLLAAAAPAPPSADPDAIVVTGERVSRTRHETAASLAVVDASAVGDQAEPDRVEQLLQLIPNVQLGSGGEGPVIRGQDSTGVVRDLPAFLSGTRPRATITVDGRAATYYELAFGLTSIWDLARLEVFRSPQTTTQGRNSIGGAIFVATEDPTLAWEGRARAVAGDLDTRQFSGAISGPLAGDGLAFRLAGDVRASRTASTMTNTARGVDPNRDESRLLRLKLRAAPASLPDASLTVAVTHGWSQMPQFEGVVPPYEARRDPAATYGIFEIAVDSVTAQLAYKPGAELELRATASAGRADVTRHAPIGLGEVRVLNRDLSIEPVANWRNAAGLRLTAGFHLARALLDQSIDLTALPSVLGTGVFTDRQDSVGLFGEAELPLASGLWLTAGLRRQHDRQQREGGLTGARLTLPVDYDRSFSAWLPKLSLAWDPSPDVRLGVLVQRASNPGGLNLNTSSGRVEIFEDEALWAYEIFARARLPGSGLSFGGNAFHYAMTDAQRTQTVELTLPNGTLVTGAKVDNAPRAWSRGLEFDAEWRPSPALRLRAAIGLLDTRITRTQLPGDPLLGKRFQRSPAFSGSASLAWSPVEPLRLSASLRHASSYFSDDRETAARQVGRSTVVDAKAAWRWRALTLSAYARILFDAFYLTYLYSPPQRLGTAGDPRELGVALEARF